MTTVGPEPLLTVRYTMEELAVLAAVLDVESLPGVFPVELTPDLRSLATRCLVVRGIVQMPDTGDVEITQPHATVLAHLFEAPVVWQVDALGVPGVASWFEAGDQCVEVGAPDDGVVTVNAYDTPAEHAIAASTTGHPVAITKVERGAQVVATRHQGG
ncbi:MAG TPA: hypothetical protein VNQ73_18945 [Ilumatobacter sp.]|nr:hypothetical protein [Ilumatobacter sp.]